MEQIKSVSHKNLSLDGTTPKFALDVLQNPFSQNSTLLTLNRKLMPFSKMVVS